MCSGAQRRIACVGLAVASAACHPVSSPASPTAGPSRGASDAGATRGTPSPTRLSAQGCAVRMPAAWSAVKESPEGSWSAESADGAEAITVLRMDWHPKDPPSTWNEGLDAVLAIRRGVDREQHGARTTWSTLEHLGPPTSPSAMYTLHDPDDGARMATMVRASPTHLCVFLLTSDAATDDAFIVRARAVLGETEALP